MGTSRTTEPRWVARIEQARQLAGRHLNADTLDIAFVPSTTAGIGLVAEGFPWRPGDNVVLPEEEYVEDHLPRAINIPLRRLDDEASTTLDMHRPVIVYCWDSA